MESKSDSSIRTTSSTITLEPVNYINEQNNSQNNELLNYLESSLSFFPNERTYALENNSIDLLVDAIVKSGVKLRFKSKKRAKLNVKGLEPNLHSDAQPNVESDEIEKIGQELDNASADELDQDIDNVKDAELNLNSDAQPNVESDEADEQDQDIDNAEDAEQTFSCRIL